MTRVLGAIEHSRTPAQVEHMRNTVGKGICPFCEINSELNKLVWEGTYWNMWYNPFPYMRRQLHLILATKLHVISLKEADKGTWVELAEAIMWAESKFDIAGGAFVMRFGDLARNVGTLRHLHAHIDVPDCSGPAFTIFHKMLPGTEDEVRRQESEVLASFRPPTE